MSIFECCISRAKYVHHGLFVSVNGWSLAQVSVKGSQLDFEGFGAIFGSDRNAERKEQPRAAF